MEDHHLHHGRIEDFDGVQKELFDSMTPDQRALVQFARTNAIYDLVRNHTTEVCPMQRQTCEDRFKRIERRTGKAAITALIIFVATTAWAAGKGFLPTAAIAKFLAKLAA